MKYLSWLVLLFTIVFNLILYAPETQILADPNDNIFQYSVLQRTDWTWQNYGCPLSFECLPNLSDHVVTVWAEGYPLPFYYSHLPQIFIVSSFHLLVSPITSLFHISYSLYQYYNLTKYLLLSLFPLVIYFSLKIVGFNPILSSMTAFLSSHLSTDGLYGIDPPSFLWRGYGLTSQLYAITFLPLFIAYTYKAMKQKTIEKNSKDIFTKDSVLAAVFLILTTAGHLGIGIIGFLSTLPFLLLDINKKAVIKRTISMLSIYLSVLFTLSYWIVPILLYNDFHIISFWDPIWKFNSYGWKEVVTQIFQGQIFDWMRPFPIITLLVVVGFFVLALSKSLFSFALLFAMWVLFYFGRTTWGSFLDLIPGMKDFHQHRFLVGVQIAGLFLIPAGLEYIFKLISVFARLKVEISDKLFLFGKKILKQKLKNNHTATFLNDNKWLNLKNIFSLFLSCIFFTAVAIFSSKQTISYAKLNNKWIKQANDAYRYDEKNFKNLTTYLDTLPKARTYAGRPGNWGHDFKLGSTQLYMLSAISGFDVSQFLPETWSPLSENEQNFDERREEDYNLLNIRYIISPKDQDFPENATLLKKFGPFELREVPTSGWFDIVSSPMLAVSDKTNYINLVHLWHRSYTRVWKMHPLISLNKNSSHPDVLRTITMTDEANYQEGNTNKNIFVDFPLAFPSSTPSAQLKNESVNKQTYSTDVQIPKDCPSCFVMFKMSFHPGWKAKIDGKTVQTYSVFPFYLAVPITQGKHTVEFYYQPNSLKVFLLYFEIFTLVMILVFWKKVKK